MILQVIVGDTGARLYMHVVAEFTFLLLDDHHHSILQKNAHSTQTYILKVHIPKAPLKP